MSVLAGVATVIFSLTGAEITTVAAAESKEPVKAIASMSTTLVVRVVLFYVLSIFFIVAAVNWTTIKSGHFALRRGADADRHSRLGAWR